MDLRVFLTALLPLLYCVLPCRAGGKIEIKLTRYQSSCTDNGGTQQCDTYFYLCIDKPGPLDLNCYYRKYGPSSHYENTNNMEFGGNIGGITNPMVVSTPRFDSLQVMFVVQAHDDQFWSSDRHLVTLGKTVTFTPALDKSSASWISAYMHRSHYHVWFQYQAYCDAYYHASECDVYCKSRDDSQGHYTCNPTSGEKLCLPGWQGENCATDIDECGSRPCYNNAVCSNLPGTYQCTCPSGFTGRDCDVIDSACHSSPCQHQGTCNGSVDSYTCTCHGLWTGPNCQTQVDMCQSEPCQNNASCLGSNGTYTCACAPGWTGLNCTTEVNACGSAPCQHGGSCRSESRRGRYECECEPGFQGENCEGENVDPCENNPCSPGNCTALGSDSYICTCVYSRGGKRCRSYVSQIVRVVKELLASWAE
ncbi:delta-like protein C isoform X2 [Littorina saxatilis]|uniref:Delta-like protein n=1 Tax=Littorina saxatilis TaxID=31220 RepID=A0AAN9GDD7_9CAEN